MKVHGRANKLEKDAAGVGIPQEMGLGKTEGRRRGRGRGAEDGAISDGMHRYDGSNCW